MVQNCYYYCFSNLCKQTNHIQIYTILKNVKNTPICQILLVRELQLTIVLNKLLLVTEGYVLSQPCYLMLLWKNYYYKQLIISKTSAKRNPKRTECLLSYINKYLATNCDEATVEGTLCTLYKKSDWWELKITLWKQRIGWWWDFADFFSWTT